MRIVKGSAALVFAAVAMMMFLTGCETTKHAEVMSAEDLAARGEVPPAEVEVAEAAEEGGIPFGGEGVSEGELAVGDIPGVEEVPPSPEIPPEGPPAPTLREFEEPAAIQPPEKITEEPVVAEIEEAPDTGILEGEEGMGGTTKSPLTDDITDYPTGSKSPEAFFEPESPPQAYLRDEEVPSAPAPSEAVPITPEPEEGVTDITTAETGPHGYEGEEFVRALEPSDFVPESPPQAYLGKKEEPSPVPEPEPEMEPTPPTEPEMEPTPPPEPREDIARMPEEEEVAEAMEPLEEGDLGELGEEKMREMGDGVGLEHVYFDFDKYVIREDAVPTLRANAQLLNAKYENSSVLVEGHCDERGTSEYNLVLGERRAQAVKNYLVDLGVSSSRIQIVSYGKERPSCTESVEWCWQQNRRGHFVLQ